MTKYQAEIYDPIEDIKQFEETVELMEETRYLLQEFLRRNKKSKEIFDEARYILEEYPELNLNT